MRDRARRDPRSGLGLHVDPAAGHRPAVAGLLGRDIDHPGPPERVEVREFRRHGVQVYGGRTRRAERRAESRRGRPALCQAGSGSRRRRSSCERDHGDGPGLRGRAPPRLRLSRRRPRLVGRQRSIRRAASLAANSDPATTRGAPLNRQPHESSTWTTYLAGGRTNRPTRRLPRADRAIPTSRASAYDPVWVHRNLMGPNVLWLTEALTRGVAARAGNARARPRLRRRDLVDLPRA